MKLLSHLGGPNRLAIHVVLLFACLAFLAPRADAQAIGITPEPELNPQLGKRVVISDANLRQVVAANIPATVQVVIAAPLHPITITVQTNGEITTVTLSALTRLDASEAALNKLAEASPTIDTSKLITDLTGLEHATGLVTLNLSGNNISTLTALSSLTKLKFLDLSGNKIQSPGALATLTQLQLLNLSNNSITSIAQLSALTNLVRLDLSDNSLTSLTGIEDMTKLTHLYLGDSSYSDLGILAEDDVLIREAPTGIGDFSPLRTLLEKPNVSLQTDMLVVKSVAFADKTTTDLAPAYGSGSDVEIDVTFYNSQVRYYSTSERNSLSGEPPYLAIQFDDNPLNPLFRANWTDQTVDASGNTVVSFNYPVVEGTSADKISIDSFRVPGKTRITYPYPFIRGFPLQLAVSSDLVTEPLNYWRAGILPSTLPEGKPIRASSPLFPEETRAVSIPENTAITADILTFNAVDLDGDPITYSLTGGADMSAFTRDGAILRLSAMLDFEAMSSAANSNVYFVVVQSSSGTATSPTHTDEQTITVTLTDFDEPPGIPSGLTVTGNITARPNELDVSWTAPSTTGKPPITGYDVQYREGSTGTFIDADHNGTGTSTTLENENLMAGTSYQVRVKAKNDEGESGWSDPESATTAANVKPSITTSASLSLAEDQWEIIELTATDDDGDSITGYTLDTSKADGQHFETQGTISEGVTLGATLDFETPVDELVPDPDGNGPENNEYVIFITVTSGTSKRELSREQRFVVTVTDVLEPPPAIGERENDLTASGVPTEPTHLTVSWETPRNVPDDIPAINGYDVQYREAGGSWPGEEVGDSENVDHTGIATTALITRLIAGGSYDIRVRSTSPEGKSAWRTITNAMTANNAAVRFETRQTTFRVTENTPITTPVTTLRATDADAVDLVTYALGDTPDKAAFEFDIDAAAATAVLRFKAVPDFENPADLAFEDLTNPSRNSPAGDNVYIVSVTATSGEGARLSTETLWLTITVVDVVEFDNTPPVVERLTLVPPPAAGYTLGSEILAEVTFDDDGVDIPANLSRENRPFITLYLGEETAANRRRAYWKGRRDGNSTIVTFAYEVQETDFATAITVDKELGITVPPDAPIRNSAGTEVVTTPVRDTGAAAGAQEQSRLEFPEVTLARQPSGGTQPGAAPPTLTQEVLVSGTPVFIPPETVDGKFAASAVPRTPLVFNEFGNGADATNDWLELRNVTGAAVSLKDWELSVVQNGEQKDVSLIVFPDVSVPANGLLLITHSGPDDTRLAAGDDIASDGKNGGLAHLSLVNSGLTLPDDGKFLLILRNAKEKLGKNEAFVDVAGGGGSDTDAFIRERTGNYDTHVWPLQVLDAPGGDTEDALGSGTVWQRAKANVVGYHKDAWTEAAFTGLGYDRQVTQSAATAGTPGYPNGAAKATVASPKGSVTISEIMVDTADGTLPQWIELYNRSKTEVLNLNRWQLELQNINSADLIGRPIVTLTLGEKLLQPNQTLLIVAGEARASSRAHLPADRIYNLFELHQKNLRVKTPRDTFLSNVGFYLKLTDSEGELVDEVGNTDGNRRTDDAPAWALPVSDLEGARSSLIRRYDKEVALNGKHRPSWVSAANIRAIEGELYYGHATDLGTPGWRAGGALPVELAGFSVSRTDAGAVVLTWATESEVDNAGFNLRRSERRDSGFTLLNAALIAGAGTTGERQTYTFTDTSAKPGVEYYYQLEEVSFAGKPQLLSMRLLRGPVSAANRQLRTFGEIKRQK